MAHRWTSVHILILNTIQSENVSVSAWKLFYYSDQTLYCFIDSSISILSLEKCSISTHGKHEKNCNHLKKKKKVCFCLKSRPNLWNICIHFMWGLMCLYKQNQECTNSSLARPDDFTFQHWELVSGLFVGVSFQESVPTDEDKTALAHIWIDIKPIRNQPGVNKVTCQELVCRWMTVVCFAIISQPAHRNDSDLDCLIAFLDGSSTAARPTRDAWLQLARMGHRTHICKVNCGYVCASANPHLGFFW